MHGSKGKIPTKSERSLSIFECLLSVFISTPVRQHKGVTGQQQWVFWEVGSESRSTTLEGSRVVGR
jgi:hypothetical protein